MGIRTWFRSNKDNTPARSPGASMRLPQIDALGLDSAKALDEGHYVYLLTFKTGEQVVLKAELGVTSDQAKVMHNFGVRIMGVVSSVAAETLSPLELYNIEILRDSLPTSFNNAFAEVDRGNAGWIKASVQSNFVGLTDGKSTRHHTVTADEKRDLTVLMTELNVKLKGNKAAWSQLGAICAVDCFIGNGDRIDFGYWDAAFNRRDPARILNLGNVVFQRSGNKIVGAVGFDTFDPNGVKGEGSFFNASDDALQGWINNYGVHLRDPKPIAGIMKNVFQNLSGTFQESYGFDCAWGAREAKYFADGFADGIQRIHRSFGGDVKAKMNNKVGPGLGGVPPALLRRAQWLGWI